MEIKGEGWREGGREGGGGEIKIFTLAVALGTSVHVHCSHVNCLGAVLAKGVLLIFL